MVNNFNYIIEKVKKATFIKDPYPHLYIKDFISEEHLDIILRDTQIHFKEVFTDDDVWTMMNLLEHYKSDLDFLENGFNEYLKTEL